MLSRTNGVVWMEGEEEEDAVSWTRNNEPDPQNDTNDDDMAINPCASLSTFKSMLENDWSYMNSSTTINTFSSNPNAPSDNNNNTLLLQPMDSSSSCSPSQAFTLDPSQSHSFLPPLPPKSCFSSFLNTPFDNNVNNAFDLSCESGFLAPTSNFMGFTGLTQIHELSSTSEFPTTHLLPLSDNTGTGFGSSGFEGLRPLEMFPPVGAQPTLFQKRAALRQSSGEANKLGNFGFLGDFPIGVDGNWGKREIEEEFEKQRNNKMKKRSADEVDFDEASMDVSGLNYDSDEVIENSSKVEEESGGFGKYSNAISSVTGGGVDQKGKKKGLPAKNLMAERRRRKKLNDRLYMLRSVVPKISKMDRASILGDAIEYLKELLQRINDLHNELESSPPGSLLPPTPTSFHPLTPSLPTLPCHVKEELCPSSLPSPKNQPAKVEVRVRDGRAVNIHMFCARRPGLLLSTMTALDNLGLDIQQAVISCFNGFALDVFRAEQCMEGQDILPEQIKAVLLDSAGFHGMM